MSTARYPEAVMPDLDRTAHNPGGPENGHRFRVTVAHAGSYAVQDGPHSDSEDWTAPQTVTVRAWDLPTALHGAADLPLIQWFPEELDAPTLSTDEDGYAASPPGWSRVICDAEARVIAGWDDAGAFHQYAPTETILTALLDTLETFHA